MKNFFLGILPRIIQYNKLYWIPAAEVDMPISYQIEKENSLVILKVSGTLSADELKKMRAELQKEEAFSSHFSMLFDMLANSDLNISTPEFKELAADNPLSINSRRLCRIIRTFIWPA